jgi:nitrite reductase/ring-hydroxylating ferredoxin subunit
MSAGAFACRTKHRLLLPAAYVSLLTFTPPPHSLSAYLLMLSLRSTSLNKLRVFTPRRFQYKHSAAFRVQARAMTSEFKLKGLTSVDLKNGQKQEVEVEGIEKGKVLLVKVNGEVHAMSANCTHYGAPLKSGVIDGDGRITCPWHGGDYFIL